MKGSNEIISELNKARQILEDLQVNYNEYSTDADREITEAIEKIDSAKDWIPEEEGSE